MGIYNLLLFLVTFISNGQMLNMGIWKDDNAIFFKLQHINESTGFFGKGLIGEGPYRFSFTPYWFIYKIFGNGSTFPYYLLIFIFYFLAAFATYKFVSKFVSKKAGKIAGLLFACGFIASEGFFWLANAMVSDVSIILIALCLLFYYKYSRDRKLKLYLVSFLFFWASAYFTAIRSYYFIGSLVLFEVIFFLFKKKRNIFESIIRLMPFSVIFYHFFILGGDGRTGLVNELLTSIISEKFYIFYGFLTSLANMIFADNLTAKFFDIEASFIKTTGIGLPYVFLATIFLSLVALFFLFRKQKHSKLLIFSFSLITILWSIFSNIFFDVPVINLNNTTNYIVFLGGIILIFALAIFLRLQGKLRNKYIFLLFCFFLSIAAYWAYEPLVTFNTTHRYMVGAFFFLVCLLAFLFIHSRKFVKGLIIIWGIFNLFSSFIYQNQILQNRTIPVESFYSQLKTYLPKITKGDLYYFDLGDNNARDYFNNAISTASMPDETSFAWRYGVDRYDFKITSDFRSFIKYIKNNKIPFESIHTFYFVGTKLTDTTYETVSLLKNGSSMQNVSFDSKMNEKVLNIGLSGVIKTLTPVLVNLQLTGEKPNLSGVNFPLVKDMSFQNNSTATDSEKRSEAFEYLTNKTDIMKSAKINASSDWMTDTADKLVDGDINTNWRSNRLLWGKEKTYLALDLGKIYNISNFVWVNGFGNSTPKEYSIEVSTDNKNWRKVKIVLLTKRIDTKDLQTVSFDKENARYIKMNILSTLDGDAPQISEVWTYSSNFSDLNINEAEKFLANPFGYVPDMDNFDATLAALENKGLISLNDLVQGSVIYDGVTRTYSFELPAEKVETNNLIIKNLQIPGNLVLKSVSFKNLKLNEIK